MGWCQTRPRLHPSTGQDVGGVHYHHNNHGDHYQPWLFRNSLRTDFGTPFPQLALAAQALEHEAREGGK